MGRAPFGWDIYDEDVEPGEFEPVRTPPSSSSDVRTPRAQPKQQQRVVVDLVVGEGDDEDVHELFRVVRFSKAYDIALDAARATLAALDATYELNPKPRLRAVTDPDDGDEIEVSL